MGGAGVTAFFSVAATAELEDENRLELGPGFREQCGGSCGRPPCPGRNTSADTMDLEARVQGVSECPEPSNGVPQKVS